MPQRARFQVEAIELLEPDQMLIVWADGHESLYRYAVLRALCECAACIDEWSREQILDVETIATDIRVTRCDPTGRYGLNLHFSDGHATGIYTLRKLRDSCPCPECAGSGGEEQPPIERG